mmetsp:Transcript_9383/g.23383  ORF Transcript_9383/g.23383 Transcript_9383/m.23383 type:complete len:262 (-) Transcript_9383:464-1249(-)
MIHALGRVFLERKRRAVFNLLFHPLECSFQRRFEQRIEAVRTGFVASQHVSRRISRILCHARHDHAQIRHGPALAGATVAQTVSFSATRFVEQSKTRPVNSIVAFIHHAPKQRILWIRKFRCKGRPLLPRFGRGKLEGIQIVLSKQNERLRPRQYGKASKPATICGHVVSVIGQQIKALHFFFGPNRECLPALWTQHISHQKRRNNKAVKQGGSQTQFGGNLVVQFFQRGHIDDANRGGLRVGSLVHVGVCFQFRFRFGPG